MYYEVDGQERITHLPAFPFKLYFWLVKYYNEVIFLLNLYLIDVEIKLTDLKQNDNIWWLDTEEFPDMGMRRNSNHH